MVRGSVIPRVVIGLTAFLTACGSGNTTLDGSGKPSGSSIDTQAATLAEVASAGGSAAEIADSIIAATSGQASTAIGAVDIDEEQIAGSSAAHEGLASIIAATSAHGMASTAADANVVEAPTINSIATEIAAGIIAAGSAPSASEVEAAAASATADDLTDTLIAAASEDSPAATGAGETAVSTTSVPDSDAVVKIGFNVAERVPDFYIRTLDFAEIQSTELHDSGRPVFLYFFATWCSSCLSELRSLKSIYPEFVGEVDFYAVSIDPSAGRDELELYGKQNGLTFPIVDAGFRMLSDLWINQQSYKLAFDGDGIIVYRKGFGSGHPAEYKSVLAKLAAASNAGSDQ